VSFVALRKRALALPGVEEGTSYGTPALRASRKIRPRHPEEGEKMVLRVEDDDQREALLEAQPRVFFVTDHYRGHPLVLVRLPAVHLDALAELFEQAWRRAAPRRLVASRDRSSKRDTVSKG
jgi:hypothetical protein